MKLNGKITLLILIVVFIFTWIYYSNDSYDSYDNYVDIYPISNNSLGSNDGVYTNFNNYPSDQFPDVDVYHWDHMPVTFTFDNSGTEKSRDCPDFQKERVRNAFQIIDDSTEGIVSFKEEEIYGDIFIWCYGVKGSGGYMSEGDAYNNVNRNIITQGDLSFYTHRNCGTWPDVEIHEILHLFEYGHKDDKWSIMNPIAARCDLGKIDEDIVADLKNIYSS